MNRPEIFWLVASALFTASLWMPYVINRMIESGIGAALRNPTPGERPKALWAERLMAAHRNAVENLIVFAALVMSVEALGATSSTTAYACSLYFFARLAHVIVYTAGIPVLRTLAFLSGFAAQVMLALSALKVAG